MIPWILSLGNHAPVRGSCSFIKAYGPMFALGHWFLCEQLVPQLHSLYFMPLDHMIFQVLVLLRRCYLFSLSFQPGGTLQCRVWRYFDMTRLACSRLHLSQ